MLSSFLYSFIARQHAMHAERDIVIPIPSVRPSVSVGPVPVLCLSECTYRHITVFDILVGE